MKNKRKIPKPVRLTYFIAGMIILVFLSIYSFNLGELPRIVTLGKDISLYFYPPFLILLAIYGSSLVKTSFTGKNEIDV